MWAVWRLRACCAEPQRVLPGMQQARLWQLGKLMPVRLAQHMEAYGTLPVRSACSQVLGSHAGFGRSCIP